MNRGGGFPPRGGGFPPRGGPPMGGGPMGGRGGPGGPMGGRGGPGGPMGGRGGPGGGRGGPGGGRGGRGRYVKPGVVDRLCFEPIGIRIRRSIVMPIRIRDPDLDQLENNADPHADPILSLHQCCGSGSVFTGSTCFWASWIRIRIH